MFRLSRSECHQVARVLQSYLDGEVDPPTSSMVSAHLEVCRRCGLEVSAYRAIKTAISGTDPTTAPVDEDAVQRLRLFADQLAKPQD